MCIVMRGKHVQNLNLITLELLGTLTPNPKGGVSWFFRLLFRLFVCLHLFLISFLLPPCVRLILLSSSSLPLPAFWLFPSFFAILSFFPLCVHLPLLPLRFVCFCFLLLPSCLALFSLLLHDSALHKKLILYHSLASLTFLV